GQWHAGAVSDRYGRERHGVESCGCITDRHRSEGSEFHPPLCHRQWRRLRRRLDACASDDRADRDCRYAGVDQSGGNGVLVARHVVLEAPCFLRSPRRAFVSKAEIVRAGRAALHCMTMPETTILTVRLSGPLSDRDKERAEGEAFDRLKAELAHAFAAPESSY